MGGGGHGGPLIWEWERLIVGDERWGVGLVSVLVLRMLLGVGLLEVFLALVSLLVGEILVCLGEISGLSLIELAAHLSMIVGSGLALIHLSARSVLRIEVRRIVRV